VEAGFVTATGAFPPLTISAGASGFSSTTDLSATTDLAGAEEVTGLATVGEPLLPVLASFSSAEEFDDRRVMSGCETGAGVAAAVVAGVG
jgi:hypothetical protein